MNESELTKKPKKYIHQLNEQTDPKIIFLALIHSLENMIIMLSSAVPNPKPYRQNLIQTVTRTLLQATEDYEKLEKKDG